MTKAKDKGQKVHYTRISSEKSDFENQISALREKWGDLPVYQDLMSATKERPEFTKLLMTLPKGSTIYVVHPDRISRQTYELMGIIHIAMKRKITIESIHKGVLNDEHPIINALMGFAAEEERKSISRRTKDGIAKQRLKYDGLWGAQLARAAGTYSYGTKEVRPVYKICLPYLKDLRAKGKTFEQIAKAASIEFGEPISKTHVYRLLTA